MKKLTDLQNRIANDTVETDGPGDIMDVSRNSRFGALMFLLGRLGAIKWQTAFFNAKNYSDIRLHFQAKIAHIRWMRTQKRSNQEKMSHNVVKKIQPTKLRK
jgi:hypothetical protein